VSKRAKVITLKVAVLAVDLLVDCQKVTIAAAVELTQSRSLMICHMDISEFLHLHGVGFELERGRLGRPK
jgi:hypothetical protein